MSSYPAAERRRRRRVLVARVVLLTLAVVAVLGVAIGLANTTHHSGKKTAKGIVSIANKADYQLDGTTTADGNKGCHGVGDFTDISAGGTVTISDDVGRMLATTNLGEGSVDPNGFCVFPFSAQVPAGRGPYGVQLTRRQVVKVYESDLFTLVTLTLGA